MMKLETFDLRNNLKTTPSPQPPAVVIQVLEVVKDEEYLKEMGIRDGCKKILEKEAMRIMGKLPTMTPGKQRGRAVRVPFSYPINFRLQQ